MILTRLYELAIRKKLADDPAFEDQAVPYIIKVGAGGAFIGIEPRRGKKSLPGKKGAPPKEVDDSGFIYSVPRPHGNPGTQGFARYFADTLPRVLPITDDAKSERSRKTFWEQIDKAAIDTGDQSLAAIQAFGQAFSQDSALTEQIKKEIERLDPGVSERCTFEVLADQGKPIVQKEVVRQWYRQFFATVNSSKQVDGPTGLCQITGEVGPLPPTHSIKLSGIPGGSPMGVSIVSNDKAAFESYGLDKAANAGVGYPGSEGYLRALTALIGNKLGSNVPRSNLRVGNVLFLYWTRNDQDVGFMNLFEQADPAQIEHLFKSVHAGKESHSVSSECDFYLLGLSGNSARAIVRDYLEAPLPRVRANLAQWFLDLRIADISKEGAGKPSSRFPLWLLAAATALDMDQVAPETPTRLLEAALKGEPVCESLLVACLRRLRADGSEGFRPHRMALIKLILHRRNVNVSATLNDDERNTAYVCGRLLAVFEMVQRAAIGSDINANVVDKYFGTFSASPSLVLGRLYANVQNHMRKLRGQSESKGLYVTLDKMLVEVSGLLRRENNGQPCPVIPKRQLTLHEQGLFALGYYHQRAKRFEDIADRKAAKAEAEAEASGAA